MKVTVEELRILRASLIYTRKKYYAMMGTLNVTINNIAIDGLKNDIDAIDGLLDKIGAELI